MNRRRLRPQITAATAPDGEPRPPRSLWTRAITLVRLEAVAVVAGLFVLFGWATDRSALTSVSAGFAPMKPNTALALVLAGLAVALVRPARRSRWRDLVGCALAAVVAAIGLATLAEHAFGWNLRTDGLLFDVAQEIPNPSLRRMGVNTALGLVAISLSIVLLARGRVVVAQVGALVSALIGLVSLLAYVYEAPLLEQGFFANVSRMALHTSLALLALAAAVLLARPGVGIMAVASGSDAGAVMFRRLLPPIVVVSVFAGWLRLEGEQAGLYDTEIGLALHVGFLIATMAALVWVTARSLQRSERQRNRVEQERATLAAHLGHVQRLEALGRLAGGISHDFNNLLGVIGGFARHARSLSGHDDALATDLDEIVKASDRAADLTRQLLAFSRSQEVRTRVLDLNEVVRAMERMLRRLIGENLEFRVTLAENLPPIEFDRPQLEQAIVNLVVNARDALAGVGRIEIATHCVELRDTSRLTRQVEPGTYVALSVSDSGHGIAAEALEHLFEPFFTTKSADGGTGLGLAMVYGVVDRAQGAIGVESEPDVGARFTLYLPRAAAVAPEPERERQPVTAVPGTDAQTILVAEDEASFRMLLRVVLSEAGYRVLEAADGEAALELARGFDGVIDVLVTDAVMPRMGGPDLIRHLRAIRPETRAIQITGYSDHYLRAADDSQRPDDFIQKPFEPDALLGTIRRVLDRDTSDPWPVGDLAGQSVNADISRS